MLYFEDLEPGQSFELGSHTVSKEDILDFAHKYDPQPFHLDEEAAKLSLYGGLIASGWQSAAIYMRIFVQTMMAKAAGMGSPGIEDLRWKRPVRPGDTLTGKFTVIEKKPFRANIGLIRAENVLTNQDGKVVMTFVGQMLFARRPASESV